MFSFFASKITETGGIKPLVSCHPFPLFSWTALQDGRRSFCTLILIISHSKKAACMGGFLLFIHISPSTCSSRDAPPKMLIISRRAPAVIFSGKSSFFSSKRRFSLLSGPPDRPRA